MLAGCGVKVYTSPSFNDLSDEICKQTYHGIFIDIPTKMKAIRLNKSCVYNLVGKFFVSHMRIDSNTDKIRCYHYNQKTYTNIFDFINTQCRNAIPQKIRDDCRVDIYLHLILCKSDDEKYTELSVTKNISRHGCFIFSTNTWTTGSYVWIRFVEIDNSNLIKAQVRSVVKWGRGREVPGIGLQFKELSRFQIDCLSKILNKI